MANKEKIKERFKEGVSVEEIEKFARKYTNEVFIILSLIIATISSIFGFFNGPSWSVFSMGLLAIIGLALPEQVSSFVKKLIKMQAQAEKATMIVLGIVRIIFGIFIPFVLFAELGLLAGYSFHTTSKEFVRKEDKEEHPKEEEHI
jgi:hypothetical protein